MVTIVNRKIIENHKFDVAKFKMKLMFVHRKNHVETELWKNKSIFKTEKIKKRPLKSKT